MFPGRRIRTEEQCPPWLRRLGSDPDCQRAEYHRRRKLAKRGKRFSTFGNEDLLVVPAASRAVGPLVRHRNDRSMRMRTCAAAPVTGQLGALQVCTTKPVRRDIQHVAICGV